MKKALLATLTATILFAGAAHATNNPLHPSYYQNKGSNWTQTATTNTARYVDATNPLSPAFSRDGSAKWTETADLQVAPYIDTRNPLSPSFKR